MRRKLTWKHLWLDDKSGSWYAAKIPILGWEYIVEETYSGEKWKPSVFYAENVGEDSCALSPADRSYKSLAAAQRACTRHLESKIKKFKLWMKGTKK